MAKDSQVAAPRREGAVWRRWPEVFGAPGSVRRSVAFLILALAIARAVAPSFLSWPNLNALLISSSFLIVIAVGEAFVIMTGMIDLGVQSVLASAGMLVAFLSVFGRMPAAAAVAVALLFGMAIGAGVGLLVTKGRIPSFIVTLGVYWGFTGVALLFNGGNYINPYSVQPPRPFGFMGIAGHLGGVSDLILLSFLVVLLGQLLLSYTPFGLWVRSVGSNEAAARVVGLNTAALKIAVFVGSGFLAALAGVMITAWQNSIYPGTGQGFSLEAIAGVILGGIPFAGGRGTILGAAIGALVIGLIDDLIVLLGLPALYEYIFVAAVLVAAGLQARGKGFAK
ncbi:MAG: ABC transporter permease [Thermaerobacter sp.]|nr:ABC transporter permease [Thermaerobacter sp.]MDA8146496.1 ABC transporter permease [Thermaerobacter sp.]